MKLDNNDLRLLTTLPPTTPPVWVTFKADSVVTGHYEISDVVRCLAQKCLDLQKQLDLVLVATKVD